MHCGGQGHDHCVDVRSRQQAAQPSPEMGVSPPRRGGVALGDVDERGLTACSDLMRRDVEPGGEIASVRDGGYVGGGRPRRGGIECAVLWDRGKPMCVPVRARLPGKLCIERGDAPVEVLPAFAYLGHKGAHARRQRGA